MLDTGVDPAAEGLFRTPTGAYKMLDVIDATGAGDVDTRTLVTPDVEGWLVNAATGRRLRVDATQWTALATAPARLCRIFYVFVVVVVESGL